MKPLRNNQVPIARLIPGKPVHWALGTGLLLALYVLVDRQVGWLFVLAPWQQLSASDVWLALGLFTLSHLCRIWRIHRFLGSTAPTFAAVVKLSLWHQFFNNLLPMRLGEAVFPVLLKRYAGTSMASGFTRLVWLRLLDLVFMGAFGFMLVLWLARLMPATTLLTLGLATLVALTLFLALLPINHLRKLRLGSRPSFLARTWAMAIDLAPATAVLRVQLFILTAVCWCSKLLAIGGVAAALSPLPLESLLAGAVAGELASILPVHGVAGAGTYEAAFAAGAMVATNETATLLAAAVNAHLFIFGATLLLSLCALPLPTPTYREQTSL